MIYCNLIKQIVSTNSCPKLSAIENPMNPTPRLVSWIHESIIGFGKSHLNKYPGFSLQWRYNERDGISNPRRLHGVLNRLLRSRPKKTLKLRATGRWPLDSSHKGPVAWKFFHLMTSSCWNADFCSNLIKKKQNKTKQTYKTRLKNMNTFINNY